MRRVPLFGLVLFVLTLVQVHQVVSQESRHTVGFQGFVTDDLGDPINDIVPMIFKLYPESSSTVLWTETHTSVPVVEGLFEVALGSITPFDMTELVWGSREIGVSVDGDPELSPRTPLRAVPYALNLGGAIRIQPIVSGNINFSPNIIGGRGWVHPDLVAVTIGGGGDSDTEKSENRAYADYGTIGGGRSNQVGADYGDNHEHPETSNHYATVGGGSGNSAGGMFSTVPGGVANKALGSSSFAAGRAAHALHTGTFVWSDSATFSPQFASTDKNQFLVRAGGGVGIGTNAPAAPVHIVEAAFGVDAPELESDDLIVESTDAIIGAYSPRIGAWGSALVLAEVESNALNNKWAILREAGTDPHLHFKFGTLKAYHDNATVLRIGTNGEITSWAHVRPDADNTRDLGTGSQRWRDIYLVNAPTMTSDARMKRDMMDLRYGLEAVLDLQPVSYRWKADEAGGVHLGLIAQDVETVIPEIVQRTEATDEDEDNRLAIRYSELIPVLIKAIQEQHQIIDAQRATIEQFGTRLAAVESAVTN